MPPDINHRKEDHINLFSEDQKIERNLGYFERIKLQHRALPELSLEEVDTSSRLLGKTLKFPFIISSMTGGSHERLTNLNRNLAIAAEECQVAMGVGSQRILLNDKKALSSFQVKSFSKSVPLIANIGAVQLNYKTGIDDIQKIIDLIEADALYLHFNPLQESIQPEGQTNFAQIGEKIHKLVEKLNLTVIAKEVGSGFSAPDLKILKDCGVRWIDVAGSGGTSWSRLENHRREKQGLKDNLGLLFQDWGIPTPVAIMEAAANKELNVIGSGGIRSGIDIAKSHLLGATATATAAPLLPAAQKNPESVIAKIQQLQHELKIAMFLLGCKNMSKLRGNHSLIRENPFA